MLEGIVILLTLQDTKTDGCADVDGERCLPLQLWMRMSLCRELKKMRSETQQELPRQNKHETICDNGA